MADRYKALMCFVDRETGRQYAPGEEISASEMSKERINELATEKNVAGIPLIEKIEEGKKEKK